MFLHYTSTFDCLSLAWSYVLCINILLYKCSFAAERTYITMVCTFMAHTHIHTHRQTPSIAVFSFSLPYLLPLIYYLLSLFPFRHTANILVDVCHCRPSSVQSQTTQSHAIATLTGPFNLIPLPLLTTPTSLPSAHHTCTYIKMTPITAILHPRLTIPSYTLMITLHSETLQK